MVERHINSDLKVFFNKACDELNIDNPFDLSDEEWDILIDEANALKETEECGVPVLTYWTLKDPKKLNKKKEAIDAAGCYYILKEHEPRVATELWGFESSSSHTKDGSIDKMTFLN